MKKFCRASLILYFVVFLYHNSNGQFGFLDSTFGVNGKVLTNFYGWDYCFDAAVQTDGKIILVGVSDANTASTENFLIARYTTDGVLDSIFSSDGFDTTDLNGYYDEAYAMGIQSDGKIDVTGVSYGSGSNLYCGTVRYDTIGVPDTTFGINGKVSTAVGNSIVHSRAVAISQNGKIIVGGSALFSTYDCILIQYNSNGSLDSSFGNSGIVNTALPGWQIFWNLAVQPDGKILGSGFYSLQGGFGSYPGSFFMVRYNTNGLPDSTFNGTGILIDSISGYNAGSMVLQSDGKIILGGSVNYQTIDRIALARYNSNGTLDSTFGINGRVMTALGNTLCRVFSLALQLDGKILAAGYADIYSSAFTLLRYNSNGTVDSTFGVNGVIANMVGPSTNDAFSVNMQPSGKIIVSGWSAMPGGPDFSMVRYDNNFNTSINFISVTDKNLLIIPNPLTSQAKIIFKNPGKSNYTFTLYDITGRIVEKYLTNENEIIFKKENKQSGLYIFNLINEKTGEMVDGKILIN